MRLGDGQFEINSGSFENGKSGVITGNGSIHVKPRFTNRGEISPGEAAGQLLIDGKLVLEPTSLLKIEIGGTDFREFDTLRVSRDLFIGGHLNVSLINDFRLALNQEFTIVDVGGNAIGEFVDLGEASLVGVFGDIELFITYAGGDDNDIVLFTAVPEPTSLLLVGWATLGILSIGRHGRCL